jgi:hypothetical protein
VIVVGESIMDKQKRRFSKFDLFLLFLPGLLAVFLLVTLIVLLLLKDMDGFIAVLVAILPMPVAAVIVIYQMQRQHKDNKHLQLSNHKEELKLKVYKEISECVGYAQKCHTENHALINKLISQYHNCIIFKDPVRNPHPKIDIKQTELSGVNSRMLKSLIKLMYKLEEYEIVNKYIEIFRVALYSVHELALEMHLEFQRHIFIYLHVDVSKETQERLGVSIEHVNSPTEQDLEVIEDSFWSYSDALFEVSSFVGDLSKGAQNILLGALFNNQVTPRKPLEPHYVVVTTKPEEQERLRAYFIEKDNGGLTQYRKDFIARVEKERITRAEEDRKANESQTNTQI